ncbi:MAG: hypothetical protein KA170_16135 [Candidatus Promineofilum sp.]|nr:hypothetical protein [Promineifilum sp.]
MFKRFTLLAVVVMVMVVACTPSGGTIEDAADATSAVPPVGTPLVEPTATAEAPAEMPADDGGELSSGEVPLAMFDAVVADALARSGASRSSVAVSAAEQVEWSDGSLGCPAPDMMYTQAIVPGYHVVLDVGGQTYDYRLSARGLMVLCENGLPVTVGE